MGLDNVKEGKILYHLTELRNMESIINHGLMSRKQLISNRYIFQDVADLQIIDKRKKMGLDQYIPFHFHPYSAFDVAVKNAHLSDKFVYVCIKRALAKFNNFKVLIKHPLSQSDCILYDYDVGIEKIDWDTMKQVGATDEYSRNVKMAECITEKNIPAELFQCIYVPDLKTKQYIEKLFRNKGIVEQPPYVSVQDKWF